MSHSKSVNVNIWTCDNCRKQDSVTHKTMPVGWASTDINYSAGGDEDYDDCRRYGYKDRSTKTLCRNCVSALTLALEQQQRGYKPEPVRVPAPETHDDVEERGLYSLMLKVQHGWSNSKSYTHTLNGTEFAAHILLHLHKQVGKLSGLIEPMQHGHVPDHAQVSEQIAFTLVDTLRLVPLLGISTASVHKTILDWYAEKLASK